MDEKSGPLVWLKYKLDFLSDKNITSHVEFFIGCPIKSNTEHHILLNDGMAEHFLMEISFCRHLVCLSRIKQKDSCLPRDHISFIIDIDDLHMSYVPASISHTSWTIPTFMNIYNFSAAFALIFGSYTTIQVSIYNEHVSWSLIWFHLWSTL